MAQVKFDSDLMKQLIPAVPIPETAHFGVVHDEQNRPMIFSIGNDGILYLIKSGPDGKNQLVNLSKKFKLTTDALSFAISEDADHTIYLVFAEVGSDQGSRLYVMAPNKSSEVDWIGSTDLTPNLLKGESKPVTVRQLFLGNNNDGNGYPLSVVVFEESSRPSLDVNRIAVDSEAGSWALETDLTLPENAANMTDMCVGSLRSARGLFVLYEIQQSYSLKFVGVEDEYGISFTTDLVVPSGAHSLASFTNGDGYTDLLVGGDGLHHFTSSDASHSGSQGTLVTSDALFQGLQQLYVAKADQKISVWAKNRDDTIVYQLMNLDTSSPTAPVPLLPRAGAGRFAALLNPANGLQQFFVIGKDNNLRLLEQSGDTRLWKTTPVAIPSIGKNLEFSSYTSHINLTDSEGKPLLGAEVFLSSSGWTDIIVNGRIYGIDQDGIPVTTDSLGNITIILDVDDITSHVFTLKEVSGGQTLGGRTHIIDPSKKIIDGLATIKSGDDLRKAKLKNGQELLSHSEASEEDIDNAAIAISQLNDILSQLPSDGTSRSNTATVAGYDIGDTLWDVWHWVEEQFDNTVRWIVEAAEDVWYFIVDLGGEVLRFVLDNATHVLKAISWVMKNVLGIDLEMFIQWLGFIFEWDDILATHGIIVKLTNEAMSWGADNVSSFAEVVDNFFLGFRDTVRDLTIPTALEDTKVGWNPEDRSSDSLINTPGGNWCNYQLEHGDIFSVPPYDNIGETDPISELWHDVLEPLLTSLEDTASKIGIDLLDMLGTNPDCTVAQLFQKLGSDVLVGFVDALRTISVGVIRLLEDVIRAFKDVINASIDIPLLTPLYELISGGSNLTLLDAFALLIAIPSTISYKAATGKPPGPNIPSWKDIIDTAHTGTSYQASDDLLLYYSYLSGAISTVTSVYGSVLSMLQWQLPTQDITKSLGKWGLVIGLIGVALSFPVSSKPKPGLVLQRVSWGLGAGQILLVKVLLPLLTLPDLVMDRISGVVGVVVSTTQFGLDIATSVVEWQATEEEFPDKNDTAIVLKASNVSLTFVSKTTQASGKIVGKETPPTAEVSNTLEVIGVGFSVLGSFLGLGRLSIDTLNGKYHWVVDGIGNIS